MANKRKILFAALIVLFLHMLAIPAVSADLPNINYDFNGVQRGGTSSIGALDYSDGSATVAIVPQNLRIGSSSDN